MRDVSLAGSAGIRARIRVRVKILALVTRFLDVVGQNAESTVCVAAPFWMRPTTRDSVSQRSRDRLSHRWWVAGKHIEGSVSVERWVSRHESEDIESMMFVVLNGWWARFPGKLPRSVSTLTEDKKRRINATNFMWGSYRRDRTSDLRISIHRLTIFHARKTEMQITSRSERRNGRAVPKRIQFLFSCGRERFPEIISKMMPSVRPRSKWKWERARHKEQIYFNPIICALEIINTEENKIASIGEK